MDLKLRVSRVLQPRSKSGPGAVFGYMENSSYLTQNPTIMSTVPAIFKRALSAAAIALALCACTKDPYAPETTVKPADWRPVSSSGDVIASEDIALEFPSGAFNGESKVAISPAAGKFDDMEQCSPAYQVTLPSTGTQKPFKVTINYAGDENVAMVVKTPTFSKSAGRTGSTVFPIPFTLSGDGATATIPVAPDAGNREPYFIVGLVKYYDPALTKAPETRAEGEEKKEGRFQFMDFSSNRAYYGSIPPDIQKMWDLDNVLRSEYIPFAFQSLKGYNFELPTDIVVFKVETFSGKDASAWGFSESSAFYNDWGYIRLNAKKLKELSQQIPYSADLVGQIRQTLVHELFHTVHDWVYDTNRTPWERASAGADGDQWSMLSESIACWVEKTAGNKLIGENCIAFADGLLTSFWPREKSMAEYQNHGYGLGLFTEWLSRKTSNTSIVKLVQYQRAGVKSLSEAYDKFLDEARLKFFTPDDYWAFASSVVSRQFDSRIQPETFGKKKGITKDSFTLNSEVFSYGVAIDHVGYAAAMVENEAYESKSIRMTQDRTDLITRVYLDNGEKFKYVGEFTKEKPLSVPFKTYKNSGCKVFTLVTARYANMEKGGAMQSRMNFEIVQNVSSISYEKGKYWGSWGGSQITVTPSTNGWKVTAEGSSGKVSFILNKQGDKFGALTSVSIMTPEGTNIGQGALPLQSLEGDYGVWSGYGMEMRLRL